MYVAVNGRELLSSNQVLTSFTFTIEVKSQLQVYHGEI